MSDSDTHTVDIKHVLQHQLSFTSVSWHWSVSEKKMARTDCVRSSISIFCFTSQLLSPPTDLPSSNALVSVNWLHQQRSPELALQKEQAIPSSVDDYFVRLPRANSTDSLIVHVADEKHFVGEWKLLLYALEW